MLAIKPLITKAGKNRLNGKKRPKKVKNKNEKENGRPGDNKAGGRGPEVRCQRSGVREQKLERRR